MIPKFAIEKAINGGWKEEEISRCTIAFYEPNGCNGGACYIIDFTYNDPISDKRKGDKYHYTQWQIALDLTFWRALGKDLAWEEKKILYRRDKVMGAFVMPSGAVGDSLDVNFESVYRWHYNALHFYDIVLSNGDLETFWNELLK